MGVNAFQVEEELDLERLKVDPAIEQAQRDRLAELAPRRDATRASELLTRLERRRAAART